MTDGVKLLADFSGLSKTKVLSIWEEVKENAAKLKACPRHRFPGGDVKLGQRVTCLECGGWMNLTRAGEYVNGYEAAGGDADNVWPGWREKPS